MIASLILGVIFCLIVLSIPVALFFPRQLLKLAAFILRWRLVWTEDADGEIRLRKVNVTPFGERCHAGTADNSVILNEDGTTSGKCYVKRWKPYGVVKKRPLPLNMIEDIVFSLAKRHGANLIMNGDWADCNICGALINKSKFQSTKRYGMVCINCLERQDLI